MRSLVLAQALGRKFGIGVFAKSTLQFSLAFCLGLMLTNLFGCSNSLNTGEALAKAEMLKSDLDNDKSKGTHSVKATDEKSDDQKNAEDNGMNEDLHTATFGNGCYWCTEAVFQRVKGVKSVVSGFSGGHVENPTYYQVCRGDTGHAEVLQITYDANEVSFGKLLEIFWKTHDPTTLNRQGNDTGPQYRSAIFYHDEEQKQQAEKYKKLLDESGAFRNPIVTEITKFDQFYPAPDEHQDYYNREKDSNPYCGLIQYKLEKFRAAFSDVIDEEKDVIK